MEFVLAIILILALLILMIWIGLQVKPAPFPKYAKSGTEPKTIPLPEGLPKPVDRFYRVMYGDRIPVISSIVVDGRGMIKPFGPAYLPARFRFTHIAGQGYRHYFEVTFYGYPIMKVNEKYVDGKGKMELPFATEEGEKINQGANLGLWAETAWFPAVYLTDSRVQWLPVNGDTAILKVPFESDFESFIVRFNPKTGYLDWMESMRYHDSTSEEKVLWLNKTESMEIMDGKVVSQTGSAIWMDNGKPWAYFTLESIIFNTDVEEYIRQKGL
jgi:hypothetical protein